MKKDQGIETLRTLAMFWIVFAHVGGISPGSGLGFSDQGFMQYLMQSIGFFPIPTFVLVSGFLYSRKPSSAHTLIKDVRHAFLAIVVPALVVGTAFYFIKAIAYGQSDQISIMGFLGSLFYPKTHLWFLYALFWAYISVMLMDAAGLLKTPLRWIAVTLTLLVIELSFDLPFAFLSLLKLPYMLPFFLMGYGLNRYGKEVWTPNLQRASLFIGVVLLIFNQWTWFSGNLLGFDHFMVVERMMSWALLPLIFLYRPSSRWLAAIGPLTFIIYLLHPFGAGFTRILMYKFTDISHPAAQITVVLVSSVVTSVLAYKGIIAVMKRLSGKKSGKNTAEITPTPSGNTAKMS